MFLDIFTEMEPTTLRDYTVSVAAAITALAALCGLRSWRRESKWKINFKLAREFLRSVHKVNSMAEKYSYLPVRRMEFPEEYQFKNTLLIKEAIEAHRYAYRNRRNRLFDAIQELDFQASEAKIIWGNNVKSQINELLECCDKLIDGVDEIIIKKMSMGDTSTGKPEEVQEQMYVLIKNFYLGQDFSERLKIAITKIERKISPHLKRRPNLSRLCALFASKESEPSLHEKVIENIPNFRVRKSPSSHAPARSGKSKSNDAV